mmetsp:Transcript_114629/g.244543  ORF Transcript_114629/g.244543 Transcript_114629/m.244543 type:complete len:330 (+) Transcript_114629:3-992(+)
MEVLKREVLTDAGGSAPLLTQPQLHALARGLFQTDSSLHAGEPPTLDLNAFFGRFTVVFRQATSLGGESPLEAWRSTLEQLGRLLMKQGRRKHEDGRGRASVIHARKSVASGSPGSGSPVSMKPRRSSFRPDAISNFLISQFEHFDDSEDGLMQVDEFTEFLRGVEGIETVKHDGRILDDGQIKELFEAIDCLSGERSGNVNLWEFLEAFLVNPGTGTDITEMEDGVYEHLLSLLYRNRHGLLCGCTQKDPELTGRVTEHDFAEVLKTIDMALAQSRRNFSDMQISGLAESLSDEDGTLSYIEFLQALVVRDVMEVSSPKRTGQDSEFE